jgi:integrase
MRVSNRDKSGIPSFGIEPASAVEGEYLPAQRKRSAIKHSDSAQRRGKDRLSDAYCRSLQPRDKAYKASDGLGVYLLVKPNGSKLWQWPYTHAGKGNVYSMGAFPDVSVAAMRADRDRARAWLRQGLDPNIEKKAELARNAARQQETFKWLAEDWLETQSSGWSKKHSAAQRRLVERDLLPALGAVPLADLTPPLALAALQRIEARGAIPMARKARIVGSLICRYGVVKGHMKDDPFALLVAALKPLKVKHRATVPLVEMPALLKTVAAVPSELVTKLAFDWVLLTACRTAEMRFATWQEIEHGKQWRIPAERMKMREGHLVPLSKQARRILELARPLRESDDASALIFPGFTRHGALSENALLALLARAGYFGRQTSHGFRASFSTWAHEVHEADPDVIEACLAHVKDGVRGIYNRASYLSRRLELLQAWADQCEAWGMRLP